MDYAASITPMRVLIMAVDDTRLYFNRRFDHLEQWQIVLYTLSIVLLIIWLRKILKLEEIMTPRKWWNEFCLNMPVYGKKLEEGKEVLFKEVEERLLRYDRLKEFYKYLPDRGNPDEIIREATTYKMMSDILFERGRLCGSVYAIEGDDASYQKLIRQIFELYCFTNATFPETFPSIRKMEAECIRILCSLFHGGVKSTGVMTTSGTESIILACLAYRNHAFKHGIRKPEIIVGNNAHIAFSKAAKLLGIRIIRIQTNGKYMVDVGSIKRSISRETCLIVASAPGVVYGVMDNIEEIAQLGIRFGVPVHVDATIGGFILPFMEQCDYPCSAFDFRLAGIQSISLDLHRYAYCPIGSSAVLYRDQDLFFHQCYTNIGWSGGVYASSSISGTRSGLLIALTWATLLYNGRLGFVEKTQRILDSSRVLRKRLEELPLEVLGDPLGPILAINSNNVKLPIHALGNEMNELGWSFSFLQNPNALRLTLSLHQTKGDVLDELIEDLNKSIESLLAKTESIPIRTNAMFGLSASVIDCGASQFLPYAYINAYYSTPTIPHDETTMRKRTLSIEGRKLSQLKLPTGNELAALQELSALNEQQTSSNVIKLAVVEPKFE